MVVRENVYGLAPLFHDDSRTQCLLFEFLGIGLVRLLAVRHAEEELLHGKLCVLSFHVLGDIDLHHYGENIRGYLPERLLQGVGRIVPAVGLTPGGSCQGQQYQ